MADITKNNQSVVLNQSINESFSGAILPADINNNNMIKYLNYKLYFKITPEESLKRWSEVAKL